MRVTSKTGLLPTARKNVRTQVQETMTLEMPRLVVPAPFTLRPFAGVYNPFPYSCSILCNHPADFEAKSIVKKAKDAWVTEGKSLIDLEELSSYRCQEKTNKQQINLAIIGDADDKVPEELFRKYTETDSRPVTPAPTLVSITTKTSQNLRARRCVTPDPSFIPNKEKTLLVLDLRRSHSQETVYWQGGQTAERNFEGAVLIETNTSRTTSPSSQNASQSKKRKTQRKKTAPTSATASSLKTETSRDSDSKIQNQHSSASQSPSKGSIIHDQEASSHNIPEFSPQSSSGDLNVVKRRGKKRKGKKTGKDGLKEFQGIPDPGETQVSALDNDSREESYAPSLCEEEKMQERRLEDIQCAKPDTKLESEEFTQSFLDWEILKQLQRQLDQEVVDSELNLKRKIALEEALRCKINPKHVPQGEEMKSLKKEFQPCIKDSEKWLSIPRVFTRRSARFELPMDSRLLNDMTPLQYVQRYVYASPERLVLYNHVFNLHKEELEDDDDDDNERDRIILGKNVVTALGKIMGRAMTATEGQQLQNLLGWKEDAEIDFRTFTGISAACERLMGPQFCSKMPSQEEDPRYEVERADFETLDGKLLRLNPDRKLVSILKSIRDL